LGPTTVPLTESHSTLSRSIPAVTYNNTPVSMRTTRATSSLKCVGERPLPRTRLDFQYYKSPAAHAPTPSPRPPGQRLDTTAAREPATPGISSSGFRRVHFHFDDLWRVLLANIRRIGRARPVVCCPASSRRWPARKLSDTPKCVRSCDHFYVVIVRFCPGPSTS